MAMNIPKDSILAYGKSGAANGSYGSLRSDDTEEVRGQKAAEKAQKAEKAKEAGGSAKLREPQDEYIRGEQSGKKPSGLYWIGQDEDGRRKIFFDDPKAARADGREDPKAAEGRPEEEAGGSQPKVGGNGPGKPEKCVANTDAVEREIRKLKEKKQRLEQQLQSASREGATDGPSGKNSARKIRELEKKLAQVEQELSQKDNDAYRRQHTVFSQEG